MTTPTGEAIEKEFDLEAKLNEFREYFDKTLKPKKPTIKNLERELLVDFIRKAFLAGRQSMADEIEGEMPEEKDPNGNDYSYKSRDWNACRAQVLEIIAKLKANPTYHEPQPDK